MEKSRGCCCFCKYIYIYIFKAGYLCHKLVFKEEKFLRHVLAVCFFSLGVAIVPRARVGHGHRQCWRPSPLQQPLSEATPMKSRYHQAVLLARGGPWLGHSGTRPCCLPQGTWQGLSVQSCSSEAGGNEIM